MRKFIINSLIFLLIIVLFTICIHLFLIKDRNEYFTIDENFSIIYFGNSTVECAVNDSLLDNAYNNGCSSETFDIIYAKLQLFLENNASIDTVIIGFDDIILFNTKYNNFKYRNANLFYLDKYNFNDWISNLKNNNLEGNSTIITHIYDFNKIYPLIWDNLKKTSPKNNGVGGYLFLVRDQLAKDIENRKEKISNNEDLITNTIESLPGNSRYYLDRIVEYCKDNNKTLLFFTTPKHKFIQSDTIFRDIHRAYYNEIPLFDFSELNFPDSCYGDCVHLNYKGATAFTPILQETIRNNKPGIIH